MKRIKILLPLVALSLFSCSDYLDVNTSPNNPQMENVPPRLVLPGAQSSTFRTQAITMNQLGNVFMNNWAANVNSFTGGYSREFALTIDNAFYNGIWDGLYRGTANFDAIIKSDLPNQENYKAIAMIMKSYYMQYIVDLYGDSPYSEAFMGQANLTPSYDNDQDTYVALVDQLDEAVAMIDSAPAEAEVVGTEDVMLGGNMANWKKFANTIKMRLLLRQSELAATDATVDAYVDAEFAELAASTDGFITASVTINPGYSKSTNDNQNPFYGAFGYSAAGVATQNFSFIRASKYAGDFLNGNLANTVPDGRRGRIYALVAGSVVGVEQGADSAPEALSTLGASLIPALGSGNDATVGSSMNGYVMTLSEAKFLEAEAILRGYLGGSAKTVFEAGISASFALHGVAASAPAYLTAANLQSGLGWDASATDDDKLKAIMTQKWIALNGIHAIESYIDMTRTGYPAVPLALTAAYTTKPKRLIYPVSEYVGNSANVPSITQQQAFTQGPFWYVP
ncbi:SusD/RagB family nutrient-binding outer membrane lipoprotein [Flavobacterium enshiense]|uniref:SusD/RagB family nutrient-binding outer membrane lipoprotein n=1 Tax=Flavobacterium enshiense TaxID=1341165 RepID=UPI00345CAB28